MLDKQSEQEDELNNTVWHIFAKRDLDQKFYTIEFLVDGAVNTYEFVDDFVSNPEARKRQDTSCKWSRKDAETVEVYDGSILKMTARKSEWGHSTYWIEMEGEDDEHDHRHHHTYGYSENTPFYSQ